MKNNEMSVNEFIKLSNELIVMNGWTKKILSNNLNISQEHFSKVFNKREPLTETLLLKLRHLYDVSIHAKKDIEEIKKDSNNLPQSSLEKELREEIATLRDKLIRQETLIEVMDKKFVAHCDNINHRLGKLIEIILSRTNRTKEDYEKAIAKIREDSLK